MFIVLVTDFADLREAYRLFSSAGKPTTGRSSIYPRCTGGVPATLRSR